MWTDAIAAFLDLPGTSAGQRSHHSNSSSSGGGDGGSGEARCNDPACFRTEAVAQEIFDLVYSDRSIFDRVVGELGVCIVGSQFFSTTNVRNLFGSQASVCGRCVGCERMGEGRISSVNYDCSA